MNFSTIKEALGLSRDVRDVLTDVRDRNIPALGAAIGVLIIAAVHFARSLGYALPFDIDQDTATRIGIGAAALFSVLHVGAARKPGAGPAGDATAIGVAHAASAVGSQPADAGAAPAVRLEDDPANRAGG